MLILVIGDLFIPDRAPELPKKKLLVPGKLARTICLGNLTSRETLDFLRSISPEVLLVKGDYDEDSRLPISRVINLGTLKIGVTHGHTIVPNADAEALLIVARQMDVDVLITGGSHRFEAFELDGKFFINPGSATGAVSSEWGSDPPTPSFVLMDVQGSVVVLYVYRLVNGEIKVEKLQYRASQV